MKTIKKILTVKLFLFLFLIGSVTACDVSDNDNNNGPQYVYVSTTAVAGPVTAAVNQEIILTVSFKVQNDCGTFHSFYEEGTPTEKTITVLAQYFGEDCGDTPSIKTAPYTFKSLTPGTFVLKFRVDNGTTSASFITQTIVVS